MSHRLTLTALLLLTFTTGLIDAVSVLVLGHVFVANMTGNVIFLGFWFVTQLFSGLAALNVPTSASMGGVAWWAHIGGFLFGIFTNRIFVRRVRTSYYEFPRDPFDSN